MKFAGVRRVINIPRTIKFSYNHILTIAERQRKAGYRDFSTFGRDCMLNAQILERITPEQMKLVNELIRVRNNINQIAIAHDIFMSVKRPNF